MYGNVLSPSEHFRERNYSAARNGPSLDPPRGSHPTVETDSEDNDDVNVHISSGNEEYNSDESYKNYVPPSHRDPYARGIGDAARSPSLSETQPLRPPQSKPYIVRRNDVGARRLPNSSRNPHLPPRRPSTIHANFESERLAKPVPDRYETTTLPPRVRGPRPDRNRKFWDTYSADPNVSGKRPGQLDRPSFNNPTRAPYGYPEPLNSQNEKPGQPYRPFDRTAIPSPPPRIGPRTYVPPYYYPTYDSGYGPSVNHSTPPNYDYQKSPIHHLYPYDPPGPMHQPGTFPSAPPINPYVSPTNPYVPPADPYVPPLNPHHRPAYPRVPPGYPHFPPINPYIPSTNSHISQPYPTNAYPYQDAPQASPPPFQNVPIVSLSEHSQDVSDEEFNASSSDEEAWSETVDQSSIEEVELDQLLHPAQTQELIWSDSHSHQDEDILNPLGWARKVSVIESIIKQSHENRRSWPKAWRYSDSKTCPKALGQFWAHIGDVDNLSPLGLDAVLTPDNGEKQGSKRNGTLVELLEAFKFRAVLSLPETATSLPQIPTASASLFDPEEWNSTCQEVLRLLKARDYLILVCRDGEYLNELHSSMDAITWFQQLPSTSTFESADRTSRPSTIEVKSIELSQLALIIASLTLIIQAIFWSWGDQSAICFDDHREKTQSYRGDASRIDTPLGFTQKFLQSKALVTASPVDGARLIAEHAQGIGLAMFNEGLENFLAILSQALILQCDVHIVPQDAPERISVQYGVKHIPELAWIPCDLECMSELIQNRRVWVLRQNRGINSSSHYESTNKAFIRTRITDLARIWGPIWKVPKLEDRSSWIWYRLPGGYIGQSPGVCTSSRFDESPCHFSTDPRGFGKYPSAYFNVPDTPYLLIGQGLPTGLVQRESCKLRLERGLQGFALQLIGTVPPFRYKDSSTVQVGVSQGGAHANWSTQFKTNPGILAKDSFLQRWELEPKFRNPRLLLLWFGVEFSLCTRNARRCRVVDLLRSDVITQYLQSTYRPDAGSSNHVPAMFAALKSSNPYDFVTLYDNHKEWQTELGMVVAPCLELLKGTGVDKSGDLAVFAFMQKLDDAQQLAIVPKNTYTWIGLLKDSSEMATFAIVSTRCLEYPGPPGQRCRRKACDHTSKSVLETSYRPVELLNVRRLFQHMHPSDRLKMKTSGKFKIKKRSSRGILLGTWDPLRYMLYPSASREQYQEKRQEREKAIKVFVVSKRKQKLAKLKPKKTPTSESGDPGGKLDQVALSDQGDHSDQNQGPTIDSSRSIQRMNITPEATNASSQATLANSTTSSSKAGTTTLTQLSVPNHSPAPTNSVPNQPAQTHNTEYIPLHPKKPKLVDKGIQTDLGHSRPTLHTHSSSENLPSEGSEHRPKREPKQREPAESPVLHQERSSNPDLFSPDVDDLTNPSSREKGRRRRGSKSRRNEREDDESSPPPRPSRRRQRSDAVVAESSRPKGRRSRTNFEEAGASVRTTIAKGWGLGYSK